MKADTTTRWGHGRHLTGRVHQVSVVVGGTRIPVTAPHPVTPGGLGDDDAHGGVERAVTVHPWEHYAAWSAAGLPPLDEPAFGEHLTTVGLLEHEVFVGDTFRWGTAELQVSAPAQPDPGLAGRDVAVRLQRGGRTGFHLRVVRAGRAGPEDPLELVDVDPAGVSLATVALALADGPAAAGVSAERLLLLRAVLPADLVDVWEKLLAVPHLDTSTGSGSAVR
ncbi:MOSC domain-containing protein [Nakamurella deserti]|uniref:MOSC domain-containing protein n=1 Tax=Nakamurella deserti TaxID=2164074 RepID=UPI001300430E|nr:MOSC domain-containing protein [Nakamurella deserti]